MSRKAQRTYMRFVIALKRFYNRFFKIRGTPQEISLGLALGIFVGMTPFLGLHTVIAVMLASVVKWSKIAAGIGVFITNPFTAPFIYPVTYRLGSAITGFSDPSRFLKLFGPDGLVQLMKNSPMILVDLIIGGMIIGLPLAAITYFVTLQAVSRARRRIALRKERRAQRKLARMSKSKQNPPGRSDSGHH